MRIDPVVQIFAVLATAVSTLPTSRPWSHVVHEKRSQPPLHWSRNSRPCPSAVLPVKIGLVQQNLHRAEEFINQVAYLESNQYAQHWSSEQVTQTFAPIKETMNSVRAWLLASGIEHNRVRMSKSMN